jgi:hypothetical protein
MRHSIAHFHTLPASDVSAVETASHASRHWFGGTEIDRVLQSRATRTREFASEGLMTTWVIHYLDERGAVESPERFFQTPLSRSLMSGFEVQERRKVRAVLTFDVSDRERLEPQMSATKPTRSDLFEYQRQKIVDALGPDAGEQRMREDESVPKLVESCFTAFEWLFECVRTIEANQIGVLIVRDSRRQRRRWLTHRCTGPRPPNAFSH